MILDTNLVSAYLFPKGPSDPRRAFVVARLKEEPVGVAFVTRYEVERGFEAKVRRGEAGEQVAARRKLVIAKRFFGIAPVYGLDGYSGEGWSVAARIWAAGKARSPAVNFAENVLLIAATAAYHGQVLATAETKPAFHQLSELVAQVGGELRIEFVPTT